MMDDSLGYSTMGYNAHGIFWVLLIILIIWLYSVLFSKKSTTNINRKNDRKKDTRTPIEILEKRLAEGKIDIEEFNRRLAQINKDK